MTYLLIHGGGTTARFWDRLRPHLDDAAFAPDLPGRADRPADLATLSIADEVASIVADVEAAVPHGSLVLVAHSSGGLVVPDVIAALGARVTRIVLNAALVPPEGGCALDCMKPRQREGLSAAVAEARRAGTFLTLPGRPPNIETLRTAYGGDPLDDDALAYVSDPVRCVQDTLNHYFQPVHWSRAAHVPVTYVLTERDRPVPVTMQDEMIRRLPRAPTVVRLDCGHLPAVTMPEAFAAVLRA